MNILIGCSMLIEIGLLVAVPALGTRVKAQVARKATCVRLPSIRLFTGPSLMLHVKLVRHSTRVQLQRPCLWDAARQIHVLRATARTILRQPSWVQII
jgi:hypothetical protein